MNFSYKIQVDLSNKFYYSVIEHIIIGIVFLLAVGYLLNIVRKNFSPKTTGCVKGCGSCSATDLKKAEATKPETQLVKT